MERQISLIFLVISQNFQDGCDRFGIWQSYWNFNLSKSFLWFRHMLSRIINCKPRFSHFLLNKTTASLLHFKFEISSLKSPQSGPFLQHKSPYGLMFLKKNDYLVKKLNYVLGTKWINGWSNGDIYTWIVGDWSQQYCLQSALFNLRYLLQQVHNRVCF